MSSLQPFSQHTILKSVTCEGLGLHSGQSVHMTMRPAAPNTGIVFYVKDARIPARFDAVVDTRLCTVLANAEGATVSTVEHCMAALAATGVDNVSIHLDSAEVPIMDGSAQPFVAMIRDAGLARQLAPRAWIEITETVRVEDNDKWAVFTPHVSVLSTPSTAFDVSIDFDDRAIGTQTCAFDLSTDSFLRTMADARTFGFLKDVNALQAAGLARGGSLDNAIVVDNGRVLNPEGLRYHDEFVRHKALDAVGDLALFGAPIHGVFQSHRAGHGLHNQLVRLLAATPSAWTWMQPAQERVRAGMRTHKAASSYEWRETAVAAAG